MTLHVFKCSNIKTRTGLTEDRTGANLPLDQCKNGRWIYWKTIEVNLGDSGRIGGAPSEVILDAIERDGYYIHNAIINVSEKEI